MTTTEDVAPAVAPRRLRHFVDGGWVEPADGPTSEVVDPSTGRVVATAPLGTAADVDAAHRAAAGAFETWRDTTPSERQLALLKLANAAPAPGAARKAAAAPRRSPIDQAAIRKQVKFALRPARDSRYDYDYYDEEDPGGEVIESLRPLLAQAQGTDFDELINVSTLRSMTQAYYNAENLGHFGLALKNYAHFTSPIRRYSDLIVHRALISGHGWGKDGLSAQDIETLEDTAQHISDTERRSMAAERDTTDRYLAAYLADRVGSEFTGRINGVQRFGAFVKLDETGADGLLPIREIGNEYFHFDRDAQTLVGSDSGVVIGIGQRVTVRLAEAIPTTGGLTLELVELEGRSVARGPQGRRGKPPRRRDAQNAKAGEARARKLRRIRKR